MTVIIGFLKKTHERIPRPEDGGEGGLLEAGCATVVRLRSIYFLNFFLKNIIIPEISSITSINESSEFFKKFIQLDLTDLVSFGLHHLLIYANSAWCASGPCGQA